MAIKWHFRTAIMFAFLTLLFASVGWVVGGFFGGPIIGLVVLVVFAVIILTVSTLLSKSRALRSNRVKLVTEAEEPRLYRIVRSITQKADIPMPEVGVIEAFMPNAFATGSGPKNAAVVATRGLLDMLNDDELEGVMAHEISHVMNRDILVMSIASAVSAVIAFVGRIGIYMAMFSGGNSKDRGAFILLAIVGYITLPIAALLIQLGISRNREFLADESAAKITLKPEALASALITIEKGCNSPRNKYDNPAYSSVWISNPNGTRKSFMRRIFSTHPDTSDRVERLYKLSEKQGRYTAPRVYDISEDGKSDPFWKR